MTLLAGAAMFAMFQSFSESVAEKGFRGLLEQVPFGSYLADVLTATWEKYRKRTKDEQIRAEVQQLAQASFQEVRRAAELVVKQSAVKASAAEQAGLVDFLTRVPAQVQQTLRRAEDPTGRTVYPGFTLRSAADLAQLFPKRVSPLRPGTSLPDKPDWVLDRLLGTGGFGEVWCAKSRSSPLSLRAVKFFLGDHAQLLRHESEIIRRVSRDGHHASIVPVVDVSLESNPPWLAFEYISGGTLIDWVARLKQRNEPLAERARLVHLAMRQLTSAVAFFHQLTPPVVHRDLKPGNILYDQAKKLLRITDFGIGAISAKTSIEEERTKAAGLGGMPTLLRSAHTSLYASPQQVQGGEPDTRDDVHALGVLWLQLLHLDLTKHRPSGEGWKRRLKALDVSDSAITLLGRCCDDEPDERPRDGVELLAALKGLERRTDARPTAPTTTPQQDAFAATVPRSLSRGLGAQGNQDRLEPSVHKPQGTRGTEASGTLSLRDAADRGDVVAQLMMAENLELGVDTLQDLPEAARWYKRAAAAGSIEANVALGQMYEEGRGVEQNLSAAATCYDLAAKRGHHDAQFALGWMFDNGHGVSQDFARAFRLYHLAAEGGHAAGQLSTGWMLQHGVGVKQNLEHAARWYTAAAEQGNSTAQLFLGRMLINGDGVPSNPAMGAYWLARAADKGEPYAAAELGDCYENGVGLPADSQRAVDCYRQAAEQGDSYGCYSLAWSYEHGTGTAQDLTLALKWYRHVKDDKELVQLASERIAEIRKAQSRPTASPAPDTQQHFSPSPTTRARAAGDTFDVRLPGGKTLKLAWCPPGEFTMGSVHGRDDERPAHRVTITKGFYMGVFPVTQAQWAAVMGRNPSIKETRGDEHPVNYVTWAMCLDFCEKLMAATGVGGWFRLPSEAEWEYACRAGTSTAFSCGDTLTADYANVGDPRRKRTSNVTPVGSYPPNAWGLHDMHGNVYEWCRDFYADRFYSESPKENPVNSTSAMPWRVLRGGAYCFDAATARSARRAGMPRDWAGSGCKDWDDYFKSIEYEISGATKGCSVVGYRTHFIGLRVCFHPSE